jgi:outer membrane protein OmpA-like peptidoglycan-associated protein|nr:OmpA family protein [Candidatus Krumholzibacteria bacterium]
MTRALPIILSFLVLLPGALFAQSVNLTHPSAEPDSEWEIQPYDLLSFYVKGTGYLQCYGELTEQSFRYPDFTDGADEKTIENFFAEQLGFDPAAFIKGLAHFQKNGTDCYLNLDTDKDGYSYKLLKSAPCPEVVSMPAASASVKKKGVPDFPSHECIPSVIGFQIIDADYYNYEEKTFYYDRSANVHQGQFWKVDFRRTVDGPQSYRYIVAHDYKAKLLAMGGVILDDEDNNFVFRLGETVAKFSGYNSTFSLAILQEEAFQQSLILSPDKIKEELDRSGKITLGGIYFDFNQASLKPESRKAILTAVALMERYGDLVLSIQGHTDNQGEEDYNLKLSGARAAAVVAAMVAEGIDGRRLQSRGYGESEPVASNDTEDGRATNRRVELHKVSGGQEQALITIDFIKPLAGAVVASRKSHATGALGVQFTRPYAESKSFTSYEGHLDVISYEILKDGKVDRTFSRKEIIRNYENVLEVYNAKLLGKYGSNLYFQIPDRGDGLIVYGVVEGFDGSYTIRFLVVGK